MARARKKKAKPARKRAAKRRKAIEQSQTNWQIGAGILALAVMFGAAIYAVSLNDSARTGVANFVDRIEVPQAIKELPDKVKQSLPDVSSLSSSDAGPNESAPASN
jgi:hypothetical protein